MAASEIKIPGYQGKWYLVEHDYCLGRAVTAYESCIWGNDAAWIWLFDDTGEVLMDDSYNGVLDLVEFENEMEDDYDLS